MTSYIQITRKYLRKQKRRSILTVIGIVLSVALVTGIGSIFLSMYDANVRSTMQNYGSYYAAIPQVPGDKAETAARNVDVRQAGITQNVGFAAYAQNEKNSFDTPYKYLSIMAMDTNGMAMLPGYTLENGRLPQASGEIAVEDWSLKYLPAGSAIGSSVTLDIGTRAMPDGTALTDAQSTSPDETFTKTASMQFKIVGTLKPRYVNTLNFAKAVTYLDGNNLPTNGNYTVLLTLKSPENVEARIQAIADATGLQTGKDQANAVSYNDHLLRLYAASINASFNTSFLAIMIVITLLVVLSTIAVIYNAFNISVVERVSQFGLLRCVGATPRQIRAIVFREAVLLGMIGIPLGILCGLGAMGVVYAVISAIAPGVLLGGLRLVVSPWLILASALVGALTIYLSALLPARKAAKISPMEAVRGSSVLHKEKYRRTDKDRLVLRLLGAEGWMAWKNLGRNRRRFYITVLSMVISIVLYMVFSSLVGFAYKSGAVGTGDLPSYMIYANNGRGTVDTSSLGDISTMPGVDYMLSYSEANADATVPAGKIDPRAAGILASQYSEQPGPDGSMKLANTTLVCYGDGATDTVAGKLGLSAFDRDAFLRGDGVLLVNGADFTVYAQKKEVLTGVTTLKPGDSLDVAAPSGPDDENTGNSTEVQKRLNVLAVTDQGLPGDTRNMNGGVILIVSEKLFAEMAPNENFPQRVMIMMKQGADHSAVKARIDAFREQHPDYNVMDTDDEAKSVQSAWTVIGIFLYGFVIVISLIGCLNIINTISTNIILRTRELSVLRAIGMSDGGVRRMVAMESVLHGAAAALVGVLAGAALSYVVYYLLIQVREFPWTFPWQQALIAVAAAALVAVVSGFVPLRRINKGVIMEGIRGEE